jgi:putative transposase
MKASKFTHAQKAFSIKQGDDGVPVAEICRKAGIARLRTSIGRTNMPGCCLRR